AFWYFGAVPTRRSSDLMIARGPGGIRIISGGTGLNETIQLDREHIEFFIQQLYGLLEEYDYILFDIGAGMDDERVHSGTNIKKEDRKSTRELQSRENLV